MDHIIEDIVNLFNLEGVKLIRLSGLTIREKKIDSNISPDILNRIINQLNKRNAIHFSKIVFCPHCKEIFYLLEDVNGTKTCDTCKSIFDVNSFTSISPYEVNNIINLDTLKINKEKQTTHN